MRERLDKYISSQSALSRREAQKAIRDKRVTVNGEVVRAVDLKTDPDSDTVTLDGQALSYKKNVYYMLNKPPGVVSATEDRIEKTVLDILPEELRRKGIFPAGRLDKDTTGLLILTDDGDYAHRMLSPKKHVDKRYIATLDRSPDDSICERFKEGITLGDGTLCKSGQAVILDNSRVERIFCNGATSYNLYKKFIYPVTGIEATKLPSTSPANAAFSLERLLAEWSVIKEYTVQE